MEYVKISDIGKVSTGTTPSKNISDYYNSEDIYFVRPDDLDGTKILKLNSSKQSISEMARNKARIAKRNSVFFTCIGSIGKIGIVDCSEMSFNQQINAIEPLGDMNSKYLAYALLRSKKQIQDIANAPVVPIINKSQFESIEILFERNIKIQNKIVQTLDTAQSLIDKRNEQIEACNELIKSRFVEMFGDPVSNSMNWNLECLSDIGELGRGVSKHRPRNAPKLLGGNYPLIQTGDVAYADLYITEYKSTYSELGLCQSKMWNKGTLCITIAANIAKTGILNFNACFPDSVVGFVPNEKTNNIFMHYWFGFFQELLENQAPESAQKNINLKILSELKIIVPPLDILNQFAIFVQQVDKLKVDLRKSFSEMDDNFNVLMQKVFKGELFSED